ncbi:MAG: iron-containing alcohol dehydrogenase [Bacilli bacterium]|nr:iron-containing alcohol dehydrogenase [Bacilli bacterium]
MEKTVLKNDKAYKYGCGRFLQYPGLIKTCGNEIAAIGKNPLIIGGEIATPIVRKDLEATLNENGVKYDWVIFEGPCSHEGAIEFAESIGDHDCIIGVGGGRIMDFSKLVASYAKLPVITIPTSSATCACLTPLSVCYNKDGTTFGGTQLKNPVSLVIVDMDIMANQPVRLLRAGAYDALAKNIELKQRVSSPYDYSEYIGMRTAVLLADFIADAINKSLKEAEKAIEEGKPNKGLEDIVYVSTVLAGLCSNLVNGSKQCAIAHKYYEFIRFFFPHESKGYIHGELVATGLIAQLYFNGDHEGSKKFAEKLRSEGFPTCVSDMGIKMGETFFEDFYAKLLVSSVLINEGEERRELAKESLKTILR